MAATTSEPAFGRLQYTANSACKRWFTIFRTRFTSKNTKFKTSCYQE